MTLHRKIRCTVHYHAQFVAGMCRIRGVVSSRQLIAHDVCPKIALASNKFSVLSILDFLSILKFGDSLTENPLSTE